MGFQEFFPNLVFSSVFFRDTLGCSGGYLLLSHSNIKTTLTLVTVSLMTVVEHGTWYCFHH